MTPEIPQSGGELESPGVLGSPWTRSFDTSSEITKSRPFAEDAHFLVRLSLAGHAKLARAGVHRQDVYRWLEQRGSGGSEGRGGKGVAGCSLLAGEKKKKKKKKKEAAHSSLWL